ncbi:MAG TPA: outer membrane beta-barrel protein [Longimicrobiales bacterium]|nr:outer membrane beta-barrel protein [Longimicrobiales bacterium]
MPTKLRAAAIAALAALTLAAPPVAAQVQRWSAEVRGGLAVPTAEVGGEDLGTGLGFEGTLRVALHPYLALYGGWSWVRFSPDPPVAGAATHVADTGWLFGLTYAHPVAGSAGPAIWVRGGGVWAQVDLDDDDTGFSARTDHELGWEAALGLAFGTSGAWSLTPGVRYRSVDGTADVAGTPLDVGLRYVTFGLGISWLF